MFVESSMEKQVDIVLVNGITLCDNGNIASNVQTTVNCEQCKK